MPGWKKLKKKGGEQCEGGKTEKMRGGGGERGIWRTRERGKGAQ